MSIRRLLSTSTDLFLFLQISSNDWIAIRDGSDPNAAYLHEKLCGSNIPNPIISSSNELFIQFLSDNEVNRIGYHIKVEEGKRNLLQSLPTVIFILRM